MQVMAVKAEMFTPVLEWLDAGAPHHVGFGFNMQWFKNHDNDDFAGHSCGTVCCIAGALREFNDLRGSIYDAAERAGMTDGQLKELFYAWKGPISLGKITPAEAAFAIRSMLETGEVKWP